MARVGSKGTKPELVLRKALWKAGCRYRLKNRLPGKPDIVFPGKKVAIFVDGCFWHGCPLHGAIPSTNIEFWKSKIENNAKRDNDVTKKLAAIGWKVVRLWEHEIKENLEAVVKRVASELQCGGLGSS